MADISFDDLIPQQQGAPAPAPVAPAASAGPPANGGASSDGVTFDDLIPQPRSANAPSPDPGMAATITGGLMQGATLGWGDELAGLAGGTIDAIRAAWNAPGMNLTPEQASAAYNAGYERTLANARRSLAVACRCGGK
jgi:hypothetical protein